VFFAKRKRNIFKGPMLQFGNHSPAPGGRRRDGGNHSRNASASGLGRRSGEMPIQEEDEEDAEGASRTQSFEGHDPDEESVEEVEQFSPIIQAPGEMIEEIYEGEEEAPGVTSGHVESEKKEAVESEVVA
jgi:hypothetical protein